jgi:hypothetical protein
MRRVGGAAALVVAAIWVVAAECASAESAGADRFATYLLFGGADLWRDGGSVHGGVLWSPRGIANDGFTLKLLLAAGTYKYRSGATRFTGRHALTALMPGWRFKTNALEVTVYAGLDTQTHATSPIDAGNKLRGPHAGLRVGADAWYEHGPLMASTAASASTIGTSYWARTAIGWRAFDLGWIGPEALALGDTTYRQFRVGLHLTSLRAGPVEWTFAAGFMRDSDRREGAYGRLGMVMRR